MDAAQKAALLADLDRIRAVLAGIDVPVVPVIPPPVIAPGWLLDGGAVGIAGAGVTVADLTRYTGPLTVTGRLYRQHIVLGGDQLLIDGGVLEQCRVTGDRVGGQGQVRATRRGGQILDCNLVGTAAKGESIGIFSDALSGLTIRGLRQAGFTIGMWLDGNGGLPSVIDRWHYSGQIPGPQHHDGFTRRGGNSPLTIRSSRIICDRDSTTGAFFTQPTWGDPISGITVEATSLEGNGHPVTIENSSGLAFRNNRIHATEYGPVSATGAKGLTWVGNVTPSGEHIPAP